MKKKYCFSPVVDFGCSICLEQIGRRKNILDTKGVYLLLDASRKPSLRKTPLVKNVVYIGKAINETIFSRCKKHLCSIRGTLTRTGQPRTRPGRRFKDYIKSIKKDASRVWVIPGYMSSWNPWEISCVEEYLIHKYSRAFGHIPRANTANTLKNSFGSMEQR